MRFNGNNGVRLHVHTWHLVFSDDNMVGFTVGDVLAVHSASIQTFQNLGLLGPEERQQAFPKLL